MTKLDWGAAAMGAGTALFFVVPAVLIARVASGDDPEPVDLIVPAALLFGFASGGYVAARRAAVLPFVHATASALVAWVVLAAALVSRSGFGLARALTLILFVLVTTAMAMGGGFMAFRKQQEQAP